MNKSADHHRRAEDQSLREDVRILGNLLGEILEDLESKALFAHVELARQASIGRHAGEAADSRRFQRILKDLSVDEGYAVCRAFSTYFGLVNLAEQVNRIRRHRSHARTGATQPESFASALEALRSGGVKARDLPRLLSGLQFTPVFTAHPTEAIRRTVLVKEQRIARELLRRPDPDRESDAERRHTFATIGDEVGIAWQTDEHFSQPSVSDEVEHVLFYLTNVVYAVVPEVYRALREAVARVYSVELDLPNDLLRFASWVGGDMDGNPNVGADTIRSTLERQHELIMRRYRADVRELFDYLSQSDSRVAPSEEFRDRLAWYHDSLPQVGADIPGRYTDMPYRAFLWFVWARLGGRPGVDADAYPGPVDLLEDLAILQRSIDSHGGTGLRSVSDLVCRVDTFGFHLATLDIRQDSAVHREALAEALSTPEFNDMGPASRLELVHRALGDVPSVEPASDGALARTLDTMREIRDGRERQGEACFGLYIISMAETADDVLAVLLLARMVGLVDESGAVALDVAPLFETVDDLDRAAQTLRVLLADPFYRDHLVARSRHQHVMLGYSDSNKEAGLAASRWALQRAQVELGEVVDQSPIDGLELTLFHGRGGTISRGGGKPRDGILAEPPGALRGRLRVTEQGEIIGQKYGLAEMALRTFEAVAGALIERATLDEPGEDRLADWHEVAVFVAERSRVAYREKVYEDPVFMGYFRDATPIDVIERLRIGSRPPARQRSGVEGLRAIPWVFAWTQSRHLFTGWYGVGTGLEAAVERFGVEVMADMAMRWPFFANLLADTEMVLAKADMGIAEQYAALAGTLGADVYAGLATEFNRACRWICEIKRMDKLLDKDPMLERTIRLRNPYIDPMSSIQLDFLARWRASNREDAELERVLVETVRGIARGMQNTG